MTDERTQRKELETTEYLSAAFEPSSHLAILVRNHRSKVTIQRIAAAARIVEPAFQEWLGHKNHRDGCDVYVGMNPLKASARTRTKDDILAIRHLYVDLDHEGQRALEAIRQSDAVPPPNYVLSTSPGKFQVIWKVEEIQQDQAERLLRQMARRLGGDPAATDSTRVLRLPGFVNHKYQSQFLVRAELYSERVYHPRDFNFRTDQADSGHQQDAPGVKRRGSRKSGPLSQSEHDWAFAKRALMRRVPPDQVIERIAEFREGEKHDPLDYARRTVAKAQQMLGSRAKATAEATAADSPQLNRS